MHTRIMSLVVPMLLLAGSASTAFGQEQTERYIPIGKSPGLSGVYAYLGEIVAVDAANRTITVRDSTETRTVEVAERTRIWLDRSALEQTNLVGTFDDLQVGRTVEIQYVDHETKETADWIKVDMGSLPAPDR